MSERGFFLGVLSAFEAHAGQSDSPTNQVATVAVRGSADSERRNETTTRIVVGRDDRAPRVDAVPGPDNRLDRQSRWSANLGADYKRDAITVGASLSMVAGGWSRLSHEESSFVSQRRDLQAYALYQLDAGRQVRFSLFNVLRNDSERADAYADPGRTLESRIFVEGYLGWRVQYEQKF